MIQIDDKILADVQKGFQIPPKPEILSQIQTIVESDDPSIMDLAKVVASDVAVSSSILKVINSPFYGMNRTISDVNQAVMILGMSAVQALATSLKLRTAFTGDSAIPLERFWDNATDVANAMVFIGNKTGNKVPPEDLYSLGLFHDAGIPAMAVKFNDYANLYDKEHAGLSETLADMENKQYDTTHTVVGYYLANSWHLPKPLCFMILNHHQLDFLQFCEEEQKLPYAILKVAENICAYDKHQMQIPEWMPLREQLFDILLIDEDDYMDLQEDIQSFQV